MNDTAVMVATLVSVDYISFANHEAFKGIADWADKHRANFSMQLSEYVKGPKAYIVCLSDAELTEAEWQDAFEKNYVNVAGFKFYLTEGRYEHVCTRVL